MSSGTILNSSDDDSSDNEYVHPDDISDIQDPENIDALSLSERGNINKI